MLFVRVSDFVIETETVGLRVNGLVDGMGDRVIVTLGVFEDNPDAATVIAGLGVLVTDTVLDKDTVKDVLFVRDSDVVIETETVGLRVNGLDEGTALRVIVIDVDLVATLVVGTADLVTVIDVVLLLGLLVGTGEGDCVIDFVLVKETETVGLGVN